MKIQATDNLRSYDFIKEIKALGNLCAYNHDIEMSNNSSKH